MDLQSESRTPYWIQMGIITRATDKLISMQKPIIILPTFERGSIAYIP